MSELSTVTNGYFGCDWGQIHYRSVNLNSDRPLLVMLHQSPLSSRNYQAVLPYLGQRFRVMALDTPGFGQSTPPDRVLSASDYARIALRGADFVGAERFHLFGRATGGVFAFIACQLAPSRVSKLVLHGMPVYTAEERADRLANFAPPYEIDDQGGHLSWIWDRIHSEYPWIDGRLATQFLRDFLNAGTDFAGSYRAIWHYDLPGELAAAGGRLPCPALLIGGGRDRIAFMHDRVKGLLPDAQEVLIEEATDFVAEQDPRLFSETLLTFLDG